MRRIIIDVDEQGNPTVTSDGFTGASCYQTTKAFEDALMGAQRTDQKTAEYYRPRQAQVDQSQGAKLKF